MGFQYTNDSGVSIYIWASICLQGFANNTGTDQPAHQRSLISAFVIRFLESIICKLATGEILIFKLVFVAEETGLKLALAEIPKTGLSSDETHM